MIVLAGTFIYFAIPSICGYIAGLRNMPTMLSKSWGLSINFPRLGFYISSYIPSIGLGPAFAPPVAPPPDMPPIICCAIFIISGFFIISCAYCII